MNRRYILAGVVALTVLFTAQTVKAQDIDDDFDDFLSPLVDPIVSLVK